MAITYAEITGPTPKWQGTEIYQRLRVEAWPNTTNNRLTWAADDETHDGPVVRETTAAGAFDSPFLIPLGSDQGAVTWSFFVKPLDRIPGVTTTKRQRIGSTIVTASTDWDTLVAGFTSLTAVTPDFVSDVGALATQAETARDEAVAAADAVPASVAAEVDAQVPPAVDTYLATGPGSIDLDAGYLNLPGGTGNYVKTPDAAALDVTGDLDLRWFGTITTMGTGVNQTLFAKRDGTGTSWWWRLSTGGTMQFGTSTNGSTLNTQGSTVATTPVAEGYRVTRQASDGRIQFFYRDNAGLVTTTDGLKWTQLGTNRTGLLGALFNSTAPVSLGGDGGGTTTMAGTLTKAQFYSGIDGTLVASPIFQGVDNGGPVTDAQGNVWTAYGTAEILPPTAEATKQGETVELATPGSVAKAQRDWRGTPYRDPHTGHFHPAGFGNMSTSDETRRAAIQAAIDAANADGGGSVLLDRMWTVGPHPTKAGKAILTRDNVALIGHHSAATGLKLANGANVTLLSGAADLDGTGDEKQTNGFAMRNLKLDGNRANQNGDGTHRGFDGRRHWWLALTDVLITETDGDGYYTSGGSDIDGKTKITRGHRLKGLRAEFCTGWGIWEGGTQRNVRAVDLWAYRCGHADPSFATVTPTTNDKGGICIDHSEGHYSQVVAYQNYGDGIWVHNVQNAHYDQFHAVSNKGIGIFTESMVGTEGYSWHAGFNCQGFAPAYYRLEVTQTAEIYHAIGGSYGPTDDTRIDGIHAPGDQSFGGTAPDNRFANYGVVIAADVAAGFVHTNYFPGDGGLVAGLLDLRP